MDLTDPFPNLEEIGLPLREQQLPFGIFHTIQKDFNVIADLDLIFVGGKFLNRHHAFRLEADIDGNALVSDGNNLAFDNFAFAKLHDHFFIEPRQVLCFAMRYLLIFGQLLRLNLAALEADVIAGGHLLRCRHSFCGWVCGFWFH